MAIDVDSGLLWLGSGRGVRVVGSSKGRSGRTSAPRPKDMPLTSARARATGPTTSLSYLAILATHMDKILRFFL